MSWRERLEALKPKDASESVALQCLAAYTAFLAVIAYLAVKYG